MVPILAPSQRVGQGSDVPPLANVLTRVGSEVDQLELKVVTLRSRLERAMPNVPHGVEVPALPKYSEVTSAYVEVAVTISERIAAVNDKLQFILDQLEV